MTEKVTENQRGKKEFYAGAANVESKINIWIYGVCEKNFFF